MRIHCHQFGIKLVIEPVGYKGTWQRGGRARSKFEVFGVSWMGIRDREHNSRRPRCRVYYRTRNSKEFSTNTLSSYSLRNVQNLEKMSSTDQKARLRQNNWTLSNGT